MKIKNIFSWMFLFSASALLAIGRVYDERLEIFEVNFSIVLSIIYAASSFILLLSIKKITLGKSKQFFFLFFIFIFIVTPVLWTIYGYTDYGILKYINFILIVIPITIIISDKFNYYDVFNLYKILFLVAATLSILGVFVLSNTYGSLSVLGGGPIVFARWMSFAILILIFIPNLKWRKLRFLLAGFFFLLALAAGSRGPIAALFLSLITFLALNFTKVFYKLILFSILFTIGIMFTTVGKKVMDIGSVDRIFMNLNTHGLIKQSTGARFDFMNSSVLLFKEYPLGVGCGNWQSQINKINKEHLMAHPYPHNLILELANEYGLFGISIFLLLMLQVFFLAYKKMLKYKNDSSSFYPLLFYAFIFLFLNSTVSGDLGDARMLFVVIAMIVIPKPLILPSDEK